MERILSLVKSSESDGFVKYLVKRENGFSWSLKVKEAYLFDDSDFEAFRALYVRLSSMALKLNASSKASYFVRPLVCTPFSPSFEVCPDDKDF